MKPLTQNAGSGCVADRRIRDAVSIPAVRLAWKPAVGWIAVLSFALLTGCSSGSGDGATSPPTTLPANASLRDIAAAIGCTDTAQLSGMLSPIRGSAATSGLACVAQAGGVHLFARSPRGKGGSDVSGNEMGGQIANIDRLTGTESHRDPKCRVDEPVGQGGFAVSDPPAMLDAIARTAGHVERGRTPATPTVSYLVPPCHVSLSEDGGS